MRTDIHRPSVINPADYTFVAFDCIKIDGIGDCYWVIENRRRITEHMAQTGGKYSSHAHGGNCHICGAAAVYTALFYHAPSNTYIRTGKDCADKLDMGYGDFGAFRSGIKDAINLQTGKRKAQAILAEAGLSAAWLVYRDFEALPNTDDWKEINRRYRVMGDESKIDDIVGKLVKYGSLSEAQLGFVRLLVDRIARKPEIEAQRAIERAAADACPTGRVTITGTVLSVKEQESEFGFTLKMTVKAAQGFIIYCTVPSGLSAERDKEVSFVATVTPSEDDPKFGFGKRPKAVKIAPAPEAVQEAVAQ